MHREFDNERFSSAKVEPQDWPILRTLKAKSSGFAGLTADGINLVIRQGLATSDYTLRAGGYEVELLPLIDMHHERYAGWIANNICDGIFNAFVASSRSFRSRVG